MLGINDLKVGMTVMIDGDVCLILNLEHVKPGKGAAFVRTKLRNIKKGTIKDITFKGDEKIEPAFVEEKTINFLYEADNIYHFMDTQTYEQIALNEDILPDNVRKFMKENIDLRAQVYEGQILSVNLPNFLEFEVIETEPGLKGDTVKGGSKPAKLENGTEVQVPLFVKSGDRIKIDTRTGEYIERV